MRHEPVVHNGAMNTLDEIQTFLAVARHRSFTLAARELELSPTAVSKGVRVMEQKHGVVLFRRTTRSVALTEAGEKLLAALRPAVEQIEDAFDALAQFRHRPAGRLRLTAPRAFGFLVARVLVPRMRASYPEIDFDLTLDDGLADLVAEGYDAGIRLGQSVAQDMVAVRLSRALSWSIVGAPAYFSLHGLPTAPRELLRHHAIRYRFASNVLPPWSFTDADGVFQLEPEATLVANDTRMIAELARQGLGIACLPDIEIADDLARGLLVRVLAPFVPTTSGLYLYFPMRTQHQPKMRALIEEAARLAEEGVFDLPT